MGASPTTVTGRRADGPRGHLLLGSLPEVRRDPLGLFLRSFQQYGDVVRFRFGGLTAHLVSSPEGAQHVLVDNQRNYGKQTRAFDNLRLVVGNGLLTSEGDFWKRQRRIANPAFHRQRVQSFAGTMVRAAAETAARLEGLRGQVVDVADEMQRLTLRIVGLTLLGHDPSAHAGEVGEALTFLLRLANDRTSRLLTLPAVLPTPQNRGFARALAVLDRVVLGMIEERRRDPADRGDLLSMLMQSRDPETGEAMDDRQLRDEVMTILLAGHETTANALTWTFLLLSRAPPVARELRAELLEAVGPRDPAADDLPRLPLARMAIEESMRLYPPAWIISRSVSGEDEIAGFRIPAGSILFVSPYVLHRHPRLWEDPEGFDPRRFATQPARGTYLPFGGGPRQCIGNGFALMEAQLVLSTILRRVRLELEPGHPVLPEPGITLRPRHGMRMRVVQL